MSIRKTSYIVIENGEARALVDFIRNPQSAIHDEAMRAVINQFIEDIGTGTAREIAIHTDELRDTADE